ncbi:nucleolar protein-like protein NOP52 variant [Byssothecium circinans]|uniref:Nucleolar protein-like protein NOP52 variant n=1 Tax=Byssothecium circinans TaxID=147558 RepID=A0A6A5TVS7_9PLEO|nr:nucleolar protein-like protein NOP52 variant [Byssothecium circinans]
MAADAQNNPFIKHLASSDKKTRDQALTSLRAFLGAQTSISELDLLKLWKGLFYCLWMQDKPVLQNALSTSLATLPSTLRPTLVLPFLRAFYLTLAREWSAIDALRMDKFLFLIRQYIHASFAYLARANWDEQTVRQWNEVVEEVPLNPEDMKVPNGLRYHVLDVWVDELEKVERGWGGRGEVLGWVMQPVERLGREGRLKAVRVAAKECLEDERLRAWRGEGGKGEEEEEEWGGIED